MSTHFFRSPSQPRTGTTSSSCRQWLGYVFFSLMGWPILPAAVAQYIGIQPLPHPTATNYQGNRVASVPQTHVSYRGWRWPWQQRETTPTPPATNLPTAGVAMPIQTVPGLQVSQGSTLLPVSAQGIYAVPSVPIAAGPTGLQTVVSPAGLTPGLAPSLPGTSVIQGNQLPALTPLTTMPPGSANGIVVRGQSLDPFDAIASPHTGSFVTYDRDLTDRRIATQIPNTPITPMAGVNVAAPIPGAPLAVPRTDLQVALPQTTVLARPVVDFASKDPRLSQMAKPQLPSVALPAGLVPMVPAPASPHSGRISAPPPPATKSELPALPPMDPPAIPTQENFNRPNDSGQRLPKPTQPPQTNNEIPAVKPMDAAPAVPATPPPATIAPQADESLPPATTSTPTEPTKPAEPTGQSGPPALPPAAKPEPEPALERPLPPTPNESNDPVYKAEKE